jgi:hypothetical protein
MTKHELLNWAVPFFTLTTMLGATFSVVRLLKMSGSRHNNIPRSSFAFARHSGSRKPKTALLALITAALGAIVALVAALTQ